MAIQRRVATIVASTVLAAGGLLGAGASPAAAAGCTEWFDQNTYGVSCTGFATGTQVRATAICAIGDDVGPWRSAVSGAWSYVYCADQGGLWDWDYEMR